MWPRFPPPDSNLISILLAKYESSRRLKHIHLAAKCDITLIHQRAVGKSARPWQLLINFWRFYHTVGWHDMPVWQTWTVALVEAVTSHVIFIIRSAFKSVPDHERRDSRSVLGLLVTQPYLWLPTLSSVIITLALHAKSSTVASSPKFFLNEML